MGGDVYLTSAVAGALTDFQANESFGSSDTGITFGRYIKSTGGKDFVATSSPTYEMPNTPPAVGPVVINEIYYHPTAGKDSFIELKNVSGQAVPLYDAAHAQNTWHLAEGVELTFPTGASISADMLIPSKANSSLLRIMFVRNFSVSSMHPSPVPVMIASGIVHAASARQIFPAAIPILMILLILLTMSPVMYSL